MARVPAVTASVQKGWVEPEQFAREQLHIGVRVDLPEPRSHLPMPLGQLAIAPAVPDAQTEPGSEGHGNSGQMPAASGAPGPADDGENDPTRVEHEKADVQRLVHRASPISRPARCYPHNSVSRRLGYFSASSLIGHSIWRLTNSVSSTGVPCMQVVIVPGCVSPTNLTTLFLVGRFFPITR